MDKSSGSPFLFVLPNREFVVALDALDIIAQSGNHLIGFVEQGNTRVEFRHEK